MTQTDALLVARLVKAGLLPSLVEDALAAAEAAGQALPTEQDAARDAVVTESDIAQAQAFWWYDKTVPMQYKRLLTPREATGESRTRPAGLDEFNPYHDPATGEFASGSGGLRATPAEIRLSHHAFQRMAERKKYSSVKQTLRKLIGQPTPPGEWYVAMKRNGALDGYLVGVDGVVKTVLGSWYNPAKLTGVEVPLTEAATESKLSLRRSIAWQLDNLTQAIVTTFCEIAGREAMTPETFRTWWADWTPDGLECLLIARSEAEDHAA